MLARLRVRSARNFPSLSIASSPSVMLSRPCVSAQERLAAVRCPFHRPPELARRIAGQHVLGVEKRLHPEAAADIGRDDAEFRRLGVEDRADQVLDQPAALRVGIQRPAAGGGIVVGDRGARLHGCDDDAVVHHGQPGDVRRRGEQRIGRRLVADPPVERDVVRALGPDQRRTGSGRRRQIVIGGLRCRSRPRSVPRHRAPPAAVSATMNATGSPTWRTAPSASARCGGFAMSDPSRFCTGAAQGNGADAIGVQIRRGIDRLDPRDRSSPLPCRSRRASPPRAGCAAQFRAACPAARYRRCSGRRPSTGADPPRGGLTGRGRTLVMDAVSGARLWFDGRSMHAPDVKGQEGCRIVACAF